MYSIYKEIFLDRLLKRYVTILIVSEAPPNLNHIIRNIRLEKVLCIDRTLIAASLSKVFMIRINI